MSAQTSAGAPAGAGFSPRAVLALVLIGVIAFAGLSVLAVYAPDLRGGSDGGAHALSSSAVGFRAATILLKDLGTAVSVNRTPPAGEPIARNDLLVLTPQIITPAERLHGFPYAKRILIVLPKWLTIPDPRRPPFVRKVEAVEDHGWAAGLLGSFAARPKVRHRPGWSQPLLHAVGPPFAPGTVLPLGRIDRLQTLAGDDWVPVLVDEAGQPVLAHPRTHPSTWVLSDPDLLNNQGLAQLANARAGMTVLQALKGDGVVFDVTLYGFSRPRSLARTMLEPPWLAFTLCAAAAAVLMFLHALARFGPAHERGRAIALGAGALVESSAGLVRLARKEAALAAQYLEVAKALVGRAAGAEPADADAWLSALARRRGLPAPDVLATEAARAKTRDEALALGRKLYVWRREMTGED